MNLFVFVTLGSYETIPCEYNSNTDFSFRYFSDIIQHNQYIWLSGNNHVDINTDTFGNNHTSRYVNESEGLKSYLHEEIHWWMKKSYFIFVYYHTNKIYYILTKLLTKCMYFEYTFDEKNLQFMLKITY